MARRASAWWRRIFTLQKRIAAEKARADAAAATAREDAQRGMNNFLAHEVRNPLSVAVGGLHFIETALSESVSPAVRADLAMVAASLTYVDALMTNVRAAAAATKDRMTQDPPPPTVWSSCLLAFTVERALMSM